MMTIQIFQAVSLLSLRTQSRIQCRVSIQPFQPERNHLVPYRSSENNSCWRAGYGSNDDEPRTVYYLIRGRIPDAKPFPVTKVCLVHGSFFETISTAELVKRAVQQILSDFSTVNLDKSEITRQPKQEDFSKTRSVDLSSVKIRFRVMTEVESKANLLSQKFFPILKDNTLSLFIPLQSDTGAQCEEGLVAPNQLDSDLPPLILLREGMHLNPKSIGMGRHFGWNHTTSCR